MALRFAYGGFARPWVRFPAGLRCVFSSDPAVSSSIFVGAEREENLIGMIPTRASLRKKETFFFGAVGAILFFNAP